MRITTLLLLAGILQVSAHSYGQEKINLSEKNTPLVKVFTDIQKQTMYNVWFDKPILEKTSKVTIELKNATIFEVMDACCKGQPIQYTIVNNTVVITSRLPNPDVKPPLNTIKGKVVNEKGEALTGVSITVRGTNRTVQTDSSGEFVLPETDHGQVILISHVGYENLLVKLDGSKHLVIRLLVSVSKLDETVVVGYGVTTQRYATGTVSKITNKEIEEQPVTNVLEALSGRASGVFVQTTNGLPGGGINIMIRGKGSILAGTDPLYVIDGVPFSSSIIPASSAVASNSINGAVSPFNSLNPEDIESISILKDVDATAIYGSRASNGVVLITTKKGKAGKAKLDINISHGIIQAASKPGLLNLHQFLEIRREAFENTGTIPTQANAPDLLLWDTTKSTDWVKYMLGNTANSTTGQANLSGGNLTTNFLVGLNYHTETTVLPGDNLYQRGGVHLNLQHSSADHKFMLSYTSSYTTDNNMLVDPTLSLSGDLRLPPDRPLYNANGNIDWTSALNPAAGIKARSKIKTDNFVSNLTLRYNVLPVLNISTDVGYNKINVTQVQTFPLSSQDPNFFPTNYSYFGNNSNRAIIIEPQINFNKHFEHSSLALLAGGTYQNSITQQQTIYASNFSSDDLLEDLGSAGISYPDNSYTEYKYISIFGRATYSMAEKYILNANLRRDGSSRFGPGNQFGNFGSVAAAWLFGSERWIKDNFGFISYGKFKGSYGIIGNDQIPDYQYLSTYGSSGNIYQDTAGLMPTRIANADFHWEVDKKLELSMELGLLKDRILVTINRYQSRSTNQLVAYAIPTLTGFSSYQANLPAVVQNTGWEFELNSKNVQGKNFRWTTSFNITFPKNELKSFQNIANSSYANTLKVGEDITRITGYLLTKIDSSGNGVYASQPGSTSKSPYRYYTLGKQTPDFYGGIGNSLIYKNWQLDIFGQFVRQSGRGAITASPGGLANYYKIIWNRWQRPGDGTGIPRPSTISDYTYPASSANFFNTSYFRIKNVSFAYIFSSDWLKRNRIERLKVYALGQNILCFWNKSVPVWDPESGIGNIPPMRSFVIGIQMTF